MRNLIFIALATAPLAACSYFEDATSVPVDYDVDLIEPVEFDGSDALAPATIEVEVSAATPTADVTLSNADKWGPMLHANALVEGAGGDRIFTIAETGTPTFTGTAPVSFTIDVSSVDGTVWSSTLSPEPVAVDSCTFILDPATVQPGDFGTALADCLVDWTDANGVPAELAFSVTTASTAAAAGGAPDYAFSSVHSMSTNQAFEVDCEVEIELPHNVTDRIDNLEFGNIQLDAVGAADDAVAVAWFGFIFDSEGTRVASGYGFDDLAAGDSREYHASVVDGDVTTSGDANVVLFPADPAQFLDNTIRGLAGLDTGAPGGGVACWFSYGEVPRSGSLAVNIAGDARATAL